MVQKEAILGNTSTINLARKRNKSTRSVFFMKHRVLLDGFWRLYKEVAETATGKEV